MVKLLFCSCLALVMMGLILNPGSIERGPVGTTDTQEQEGLIFRLEEKTTVDSAAEPQIAPSGEDLSEAEIQELYSRIPDFSEGVEQQELVLRPAAPPVFPQKANQLDQVFPPPQSGDSPPDLVAEPLEVLRIVPDGEIKLAANITVSFSQPMVAITAIEDLPPVPVQLDPTPSTGKWRWAGSQTLIFDGLNHLPGATTYTLTVPAGTRSISGNKLAKTVTHQFSTPPVSVTRFYPGNRSTTVTDPLLCLTFDQPIDPEALFPFLHLMGEGQEFGLRLATETEIADRDEIKRLVTEAPDRCVVVKPKKNLATAAQFTLLLKSGAPSLEGPLPTREERSWLLNTYGPLVLTGSSCGYRDECRPGDALVLEFSNPLDQVRFTPDLVQVEPAIPGMEISASGKILYIVGLTKGLTDYRVRVSPELLDIFGQSLGKEQIQMFKISSSLPRVYSPQTGLRIADPAAKGVFSVYSINFAELRVRVYAVTPEDYFKFEQNQYDNAWFEKPQGELISDEILTPDNAETFVETRIDLSAKLKGKPGQVLVLIKGMAPRNQPAPAKKARPEWEPDYSQAHFWVQLTDLAIDSYVEHNRLTARVTRLSSGKPVVGALVRLIENNSGTYPAASQTGADGLAQFELPAAANGRISISVEKRGDLCFLPDAGGWRGSFAPENQLLWHVFDDRGLYKPGETVSIKGWIRAMDEKALPIRLKKAGKIKYQVLSLEESTLATGELEISPGGGFFLAWPIPEQVNLGDFRVQFELDGSRHDHVFQVQEFRRPEFEVTINTEPGPQLVGSSTDLAVQASYYAGGGLPAAPVTWHISSEPAEFTPPNRGNYTFGHWLPHWCYFLAQPEANNEETFSGETDRTGGHQLSLHFERAQPAIVQRVRVSADVQDINNQSWSAEDEFLVHPALYYVGLRSAFYFVNKGQPFPIEAIVCDLDGNLVPGVQLKILVTRQKSVQRKGEWVEEQLDPQTFELVSADKPINFSFETSEGGTYQVRAEIRDSVGRTSETRIIRWVSGGGISRGENLEQDQVLLIPDKTSYQPGDVAVILVQSPFGAASGFLTLRRNGILSSKSFTMNGSSHLLMVPITGDHHPALELQVDLTGVAARKDASGQENPTLPPRPAYASGNLKLEVPPLSHRLDLQVEPRERKLEPGGETEIRVQVKDSKGKPVPQAEVVVLVVDEAILALSQHDFGDPLLAFFPEQDTGVANSFSRSILDLLDPTSLSSRIVALQQREGGQDDGLYQIGIADARGKGFPVMEAMMVERSSGAAAPVPIKLRADFNPLAAFYPETNTDGAGQVSVKIKLPDNLTRYRILAQAVAGDNLFGSTEDNLVARLPLMIRPSAPRFLNLGDYAEIPVLIQNQTDMPLEASVVVRSRNSQIQGSSGRRVQVPANDRARVLFPVRTLLPGAADFQFAVSAEAFSDAASLSLPVWTPATTEAFATYGVLDQEAVAHQLRLPSNVFSQFGGLQVTTSSTALQGLTDALLYLERYPFDCSEQLSSRILAFCSLVDVVDAFGGQLDPVSMEERIKTDLALLESRQNPDGGFGFWSSVGPSWPFLTIHVAHALARARDRGFLVSNLTESRIRRYLANLDRQFDRDISPKTRFTLEAYALWVRDIYGDSDPGKSSQILASLPLDQAPTEGLAWLLPLVSAGEQDQILRFLNNQVNETAASASFGSSYGDGDYLVLYSAPRANALLLDSMIRVQPDSYLIPKLVKGLMDNQTRGRWSSTQENVFALVAMNRYFNHYESVTPDFITRVWLGNFTLGEQAYQGRSTDSHKVQVPMSWLSQNQSEGPLLVTREGAGRLYYRLAMDYAPQDLILKPAAHGFFVERVYEAIDDPADVSRDEQGTWFFRAGARIRVRISLVNPALRNHVALVDPLPAGLESINPDLAVNSSSPGSANKIGRWWGPWYQHQNLRDERTEAFTTRLWPGGHEYTYVTRATTAGEFIVPPAKAEEMYHPETFGRSASDRVVIH